MGKEGREGGRERRGCSISLSPKIVILKKNLSSASRSRFRAPSRSKDMRAGHQ